MADQGGRDESSRDGGYDPGSIRDRSDFAAQLSRARSRAGKTIRALARELDHPPATIGGYFSGQHLPGVAQTELFTRLLRLIGITGDTETDQWVEALVRVRRRPGRRPTDSSIPYRGLESFRTEDAALFFGREILTDAVVRRALELVKDPAAGTTMVVVGPSGSGKSSLLRAGVVPSVLDGRTEFGSSWRTIVVCPGSRPIRRLAEALAGEIGDDADALEARLRSGPAGWPALPTGVGGLVVVVDQFEEVFTTCTDESERRAFLSILRGPSPSADSQPSQVVVILGLRADFYGRATQEPSLVPVLQDRQLVVGPMGVDELCRAIKEPARVAGFEVDDALVDLLVAEVAPSRSGVPLQDQGALPLLSHALLETWKRARGSRLTVADYEATGGIAGAVQQTAERLYAESTPEEQAFTRRLFLRLVNVEDDVIVTRRSVRRGELLGRVGDDDGHAADVLESVVERFVAHRLLTVDADVIQVSHEALLTAWPRLRDWVDADRAGLRVHRQLGAASTAWLEADRDPAALLRGGRLEVAEGWASSIDHRDDLNDDERSFLSASIEHAQREEASARRRTRRLHVLLAFVAVLAMSAAGLATIAVRARGAANAARDVALSRQLAIQATRLRESDPSLAAQLAVAAYGITPTADARSALLDSYALAHPTRLLGQPGATALAVTADGGAFAVSGAVEGTVQLFELGPDATPARLGVLRPPGPAFELFAVAFSPDGTLLATGGTEKVVRLWDVSDRARPRPVGAPMGRFTGAVQSLAFSPDGRTLAAGGTAEGVVRWDVSNRAEPVERSTLMGPAETTQVVAYSGDGRRLAAGGTDGVLRLWTGSDPAVEIPLGTPTTINTIAFSPDGRLLAAGSKDKTIRVWDLGRGPVPVEIGPPLTGFGSWVNTVVFSPDGTTLAGGGSDNTIRFWTVDGWQPQAQVLTSPSPVTGVRFVPGRSSLVSVAVDGTARLWSWPPPLAGAARDTVFGLSYSADGRRLAMFPNRGDDVVPVWDTSVPGQATQVAAVRMPPEVGALAGTGAISRDGSTLAVGTRAGTIQRFDLSDPTRPVVLGPPLTGPTDLIEQIAVSADDGLVAAGSDDGTVRLWRLHGSDSSSPLATLTGPESLVLAISLSPDGRFLAAASADKKVWLWDVRSPERPALLATLGGFENYAYSVAFSPDSRILAAGSADKTIRLWSLADPAHPEQLGAALSGPGNYVFSLAFHPGGDVLAAAVTDGSVWQWDVRDPARPEHLATLTAAETSQVFVVAYSPQGTMLVAGDDKHVRLWPTDPEWVAADICARAGDPITPKEWAQHLPDRPYRPPCR